MCNWVYACGAVCAYVCVQCVCVCACVCACVCCVRVWVMILQEVRESESIIKPELVSQFRLFKVQNADSF